MSITRYIKTAFTNRWNLLGLLGGLGFGVLSGRPDVVLPVVFAAELGYLGMLGTHPKFQKYVDAQDRKAIKAAEAVDSDKLYRRLFGGLADRSRKRFSELRTRCIQLRKIADDLKSAETESIGSLENIKESGLDRLLWIFLKLLYSEQSLRSFFERTDERRIQSDIKALENRIEKEQAGKARQRMLETLQDNLETSQQRLVNYEKARDNFEMVQLELERLENKIHSLSEMGVNQREPDYIASEVNGVAKTMMQAHDTINQLEFITGVHSEQSDEVPDIIRERSRVSA